MNIQQEVAAHVRARGYWDGLDRERLVCRHVAKLVEELNEICLEIQQTRKPPLWLDDIFLAGERAREEFDNLAAWKFYRVNGMETLKAELADLQVVILSMAELMGYDVLGAALEKARADVGRGIR